MKKEYNKLVRDKIPQIITDSGVKYQISNLSKEEYLTALKNKLLEEAEEAVKACDNSEIIKEIADIYEVIDTLISALEINKNEILAKQEERRKKRGGFDERIFLHWTESPDYPD